jgi:hypothetical protein
VFTLVIDAAADRNAVLAGKTGGVPAGETGTTIDLHQRQVFVEAVAGKHVRGQQLTGGTAGRRVAGCGSGGLVEQQRVYREAADSEAFAGGLWADELGADEPVQAVAVDLVEVGSGWVEPVEEVEGRVPGDGFVIDTVAGQEVRARRV